LPGLLGNGLQVRGDVDLSGSQVAGARIEPPDGPALDLGDAAIGGNPLIIGRARATYLTIVRE